MEDRTCSNCLYYDKEYLFCTKYGEHLAEYNSACRDYEIE